MPDGDILIRQRQRDDDPPIVALFNAHEPEGPTVTVERYRVEADTAASSAQGEQWVALAEGKVVGTGSFYPAWWTEQPDIYMGSLLVDRLHRRQGIGTDLCHYLLERLRIRGARELMAWVRADEAESLRFAARHGFRETGERIQECRLSLPEANVEPAPEAAARLAGLRIVALSERDPNDERFFRALHRLWAASGDELPAEETLRDSFETWRQQVLVAPGLSDETHWVALDAHDRPVGMTFLKRLNPDSAENDYTGVAPDYRGRGIAVALKRHAIAWARRNGLLWFHTSSEVDNTRMIEINTRLGYRPGALRIQVARPLP